MNKLIKPFAVAVCALLAACIKMDEDLAIRDDGSGSIHMTYAMSEQTIAQMQAMQKMAEEMAKSGGGAAQSESNLEFDEARLKAKFKEYEQHGVFLEEVGSEDRQGWRYMHVKARFDKLSGLTQTDLYNDRKLSLVKDSSGNYRLGFGYGEDKQGAEESPDNPQMEQMMAAMMAGFLVETSIKVPGKVLETNAHETDGETVSWKFDIDKDPKAFSKMNKETPYVVFAGDGLNLSEVLPAPAQQGHEEGASQQGSEAN